MLMTTPSDVVGCLRVVGGLEIMGGTRKKRDIKLITDYSVTIKITLWGKLGEMFDPSSFKKDGVPYVVIVTSTAVKQFQGEISFCTTNASKLYINLDDTFVTSLRERFTPISKEVEILENPIVMKPDPEKEMFINRMNVKELIEADWSENLEECIVTVRAKIVGIDNHYGWYYVSCKSCLKKAIPKDGDQMMCSRCEKIIDYPLMLFKIHIKVTDGTSSTTFVLFNMVSERLLDMSAKKILNNFSASQRDVPIELEALVGKDLVFKLRLNHYNLRDGFANYTVIDIFNPKEYLEKAYESTKKLKAQNVSDGSLGVPGFASNVSKRGKQVVSDDETRDEVAGGTGSVCTKKRRNLIADEDEESTTVADPA